MKLVIGRSVAAALLVALFAGCATQQQQQPVRYAPVPSAGNPAHSPRAQYGEVQSIDATRSASSSGGGAVVGGLIGALLGHQVSRGGEKAVATAAGAVGGALLGNEIEKQQRGRAEGAWRVVVRLDNGSQRAFDYAQLGDIRVGDRVRVVDNQVYRD